MLVGREPERRAIRTLVAAARVGRSGSLVLTGEAGIGKSALLHDAVAAVPDMRVLQTSGSHAESEVPFGALLHLLRPVLVHLDGIPEPQSAALSTALALRPGSGGDRFATGAATLSLLSRAAEDAPLLVVVDDAHLLDLPSAQALMFAARRLTADRVAVLAAVRDGHATPLLEAGLPELAVGGLSEPATVELLAAAGHRLGDAALSRLHQLTGGNPLAVVELAEDPAALEAGPAGAPVPVPASLARAFGRRVDQLSQQARTAVLLAAVDGGDLDVVARACQAVGVDVRALDEAEEAGLVRLTGDAVVFRHDLVRSAVYADATSARRRAAHGALATALPEQDRDRRAWHLSAASLAPDEHVAGLLDAVARRAHDRSAHAVAAAAWERAARLSLQRVDRAARTVAAAESAWRAGTGGRALALLDRAETGLPPLQARIAALRGGIAARTGSARDALSVLVPAAAQVADTDADQAVALLADAVLAGFFLADTRTLVEVAAGIDASLGQVSSERARLLGPLASGVAKVLTGRGGPDQIRAALAQVDPDHPPVDDLGVATWLVLGPLFLRESATGRRLVETVVESLRRRTVIGGLPLLLFYVGRDQATTDRWHEAEQTYAEGIRLAREAGQDSDLAACLAGLAWLEGRQGREARCRAHAAEADEISTSRHLELFRCWTLFARGELELALGRPAEALDPLQRLQSLLDALGLADVDLSPAPELVDALVGLGRVDEARQVAGGYAARAAVKGQPWAAARAARALAVSCPPEQAAEHAEQALAQHARTPDRFERARTQLAYGARLRRARQRVDARPHLREALTTFEALGAVPWADRADAELRATGETARRRGASALDQLTPQERQVAGMLAAGRTTREAAAALFLSPKTVEHHLRHVYVKLGIGSRAELAERLAPRPSQGPSPG